MTDIKFNSWKTSSRFRVCSLFVHFEIISHCSRRIEMAYSSHDMLNDPALPLQVANELITLGYASRIFASLHANARFRKQKILDDWGLETLGTYVTVDIYGKIILTSRCRSYSISIFQRSKPSQFAPFFLSRSIFSFIFSSFFIASGFDLLRLHSAIVPSILPVSI